MLSFRRYVTTTKFECSSKQSHRWLSSRRRRPSPLVVSAFSSTTTTRISTPRPLCSSSSSRLQLRDDETLQQPRHAHAFLFSTRIKLKNDDLDDYYDSLSQDIQQSQQDDDPYDDDTTASRQNLYVELDDDDDDDDMMYEPVDPRFMNGGVRPKPKANGNTEQQQNPTDKFVTPELSSEDSAPEMISVDSAATSSSAPIMEEASSLSSSSTTNNNNSTDLPMDLFGSNPFPFPEPDHDFFSNKQKQLDEILAETSKNNMDEEEEDNEIIATSEPPSTSISTPPPQRQFSSILEDPVAHSPFLDATTIPHNNNNNKDLLPLDTTTTTVVVPELSQTNNNRIENELLSLQKQLKRVEQEIYTMNGGSSTFNLNSPKQISQMLFGRPDQSTNKATLEGMAATNILAKLILEYRRTKQQLGRLTKKKQQYDKQQAEKDAGIVDTTTSNNNNPGLTHDDPLLLIDTSSFIFRAYYSMPPLHRSPDGMPIGAVMGFCNMLNKLVWNSMFHPAAIPPKRLILCLDAPIAEDAEARTFRHALYPDYKAHRPSLPLDLIPQFDLIAKAAQAYGIVQIQAQGFEADDVMATLGTKACQEEHLHVRILSGDKDLMQLITEEDTHTSTTGSIHMMDPMTMTPWTAATVVEKWGVPAHQLGDVLALAGDTADNIPGVPGIGPKIAAQLLQEYDTLDNLLASTDSIKQKGRREKLETFKDQAKLSRELVELVRDLEWSQMEVFYPDKDSPVVLENDTDDEDAEPNVKVGELRMQTLDPDRLLAFYDEMGFFTMKQRFLERLKQYKATHGGFGGDTGTPSAASAAANETKPEKKKSKWTPKKKMGIPKPEEYKDVPF